QDHLDWHGSAEQYYRDKLSLCTLPGVRTVVADGDSAALREHTDLLGPVRWVQGEADPWVEQLHLLGAHNLRNAQLAQAALVELGVDGARDPVRLAAACAQFTPLESRLHQLGEVDGVSFVDDSLSTNVLPTLAAVAAFPGRRVALLVGGFDRGIDYRPLGIGLAGRPDLLVLTMPDNGPAIGAPLRDLGIDVVDCDDLEQAVRLGREWAGQGGVVLLSPAAPSFGRYADYRARAAAFAMAMRHGGSRISEVDS
ncbi:MAG: UDP-N-acetylmuramoyl-L-alanine--D-glutamate ligase, partial [Frankiales bacterium]|nr:UDP-N-acetylmuramoyl-L-alanine--D-glutamate ligase [Frankiales bacterium]